MARNSLTSAEAADLLGLSRETVVQYYHAGILVGEKTQRGFLFNVTAVTELRRRRRMEEKKHREWGTKAEIHFLEGLSPGEKERYLDSMGTRERWGLIEPAKVAAYLRRALA